MLSAELSIVSESSSFCLLRATEQRLEPSLTSGSKGWSLRLRRGAKAGAFAYVVGEQRLEPSLTSLGSKGWSLRLRRGAKAGAFAYVVGGAKAGAFAYVVGGQRLEPALTSLRAKAGAFAYLDSCQHGIDNLPDVRNA
jgi:hypothetical protein